ncbi:MAG TPA: hypothetical protein ENN07_07130 [candidate division Zixibacteria bacterium]|nr:hypothetical protein [candidate division Zixibacteria bacterium]
MRKQLAILCLIIALASLLVGADVTLHYFYAKSCDHCAVVRAEILTPLAEQYFGVLEVIEYEIEDHPENFDKLIEMEERTGQAGNDIPVVFIGDRVFGGEEDFKPYLVELLESATLAEDSPEDESPQTSEDKPIESLEAQDENAVYPVFMAYFWEQGCPECSRITYDLRALRERFPNLKIREWNIEEGKAKQYAEALAIRLNVEERFHLVAPAVFFADTALIAGQINYRSLEEQILRLEKIPATDTVWVFTDEELESAHRTILERFTQFEALPVFIAGLLDGLNPCAFGAIIFFITFLTVVKRKRREIFWVGVAFTVSVFLTYLIVGAGFMRFLQALPFLQVFARWVYIVMSVVVVILGLLSIYDFARSLRGKYDGMVLQLPDKLKKRVQRVIIKENEPSAHRNIIIAAATTGFFISLLELACTGQVYLPTIVYVMSAPGLRVRAYLFLVLYNLMFILPLIVVFAVVFFGATSEQLSKFLKKNTPLIKLLTAGIFFTMAFFMFRMIL